MKAASRSGDVKVVYSSAAVVRNSSDELTVVVLTNFPFLLACELVEALVADLALACVAVEDVIVVLCVNGAEELAC